MSLNSTIRNAVVLLLSTELGSALAGAPRYDVRCLDCGTHLGPMMPMGINSSGVIVAMPPCAFPNACEKGQGYVFDHGTVTQAPTFDADDASWVAALNDDDVIVGSGRRSTFPYGPFGFSWDGTTMTDLGDPLNQEDDIYFSRAQSINRAGHIAGTAADGYHSVGVFFYADGAMTEVPLVDASYVLSTYVVRLNAFDHVAGTGFRSNDDTRFAWISKDGVTTALAPEFVDSEAYAINDADEVVGMVRVNGAGDDYNEWAALWKKTGKTTILDTLPNYGQSGRANAINNLGWVVGRVCGTSACTAFVYNGKKMFDLNALTKTKGWVLNTPTGINDSGVIVGTATHHGVLHGFIATPR